MARALSSSGYHADFSGSSLWEVERFFDDHAPDGHATPNGLLSEKLGQRIFALGGYVGEVLRRNVGGIWEGDDDDPQAEINVALRLADTAVVWPVQRVMKRYQNGSEDSVVVYAAALGVVVGPRPRSRRRRFRRRA